MFVKHIIKFGKKTFVSKYTRNLTVGNNTIARNTGRQIYALVALITQLMTHMRARRGDRYACIKSREHTYATCTSDAVVFRGCSKMAFRSIIISSVFSLK